MNNRCNDGWDPNEDVFEQSSSPGTSDSSTPPSSPENEFRDASPISRHGRRFNYKTCRVRNITSEDEDNESDEGRERSPHRTNHHRTQLKSWNGLTDSLLRDYSYSKSSSNSSSLEFFIKGMTQYEMDEIASYFTLTKDHNPSPVPLLGRYPRTLPMFLSAGYDCKGNQSLSYALNPTYCMVETHSLDLVFRAALKELANEMLETSEQLETPPFITDRYLEMNLIQKIKKYYFDHYSIDITSLLLRMDLEMEHALRYLFYNSASLSYIMKLLRKYDIKDTNLEVQHFDLSKENIVGFDIQCTLTVNMQIIDDLNCVFEDVKRQSVEMDPENLKTLCQSFLTNSSLGSESFFKSYREGLQRLLLISELLAWMCYGVTLNENIDTQNLTQSILFIEILQNMHPDMKKMITWNYPLSYWYKKNQTT